MIRFASKTKWIRWQMPVVVNRPAKAGAFAYPKAIPAAMTMLGEAENELIPLVWRAAGFRDLERRRVLRSRQMSEYAPFQRNLSTPSKNLKHED
jgi:hypothetical protein